MTTAPFIVIEGPDGSGKSFQALRLYDRLSEAGVSAHLTREPSDGRIGRLIRESLTGEATIASEAMGLLYAADRIDHVTREILPAVQAGEVVVCDRYTWSNLVYRAAEVEAPLFYCNNHVGRTGCQWTGDSIDPAGGCPWRCPDCGEHEVFVSVEIAERIDWARSLSAGCPTPDLTVILTVTPEVAMARRKARGGAAERYETDRYTTRCCALYAIAEWWAADEERLVVVDAKGDVDAVAEQVWAAVSPYLASHAGT